MFSHEKVFIAAHSYLIRYQMLGVSSWSEGIERTGTLKPDGSDIDCGLANANWRRR
jgi:hypothetical protein